MIKKNNNRYTIKFFFVKFIFYYTADKQVIQFAVWDQTFFLP